MYLDRVSFIHKRNPFNEALSASSRVYRRKNEGLQLTAKGCKDLADGKRLHFLIGITWGYGVTLIQTYEKIDGKLFASFINDLLHGRLMELAELKNVPSRSLWTMTPLTKAELPWKSWKRLKSIFVDTTKIARPKSDRK